MFSVEWREEGDGREGLLKGTAAGLGGAAQLAVPRDKADAQ